MEANLAHANPPRVAFRQTLGLPAGYVLVTALFNVFPLPKFSVSAKAASPANPPTAAIPSHLS
jgi:hypothetical protein